MAATSMVSFEERHLGEAMPKGYHHLTKELRCQLCILRTSEESPERIALILNVDRSTIYRELARNPGDYKYQQAHDRAL